MLLHLGVRKKNDRKECDLTWLLAYGWLMTCAGILILTFDPFRFSIMNWAEGLSLLLAGTIMVFNAKSLPIYRFCREVAVSLGWMSVVLGMMLLPVFSIPADAFVKLAAVVFLMSGVWNVIIGFKNVHGRIYPGVVLGGFMMMFLSSVGIRLDPVAEMWIMNVILAGFLALTGMITIYKAAIVTTEEWNAFQVGRVKS